MLQMNEKIRVGQVMSVFCAGEPPQGSPVDFNGFDQFEKEDAERRFASLSATQLLEDLVDGNVKASLELLEEVCVLRPEFIPYFLGPFLAQLGPQLDRIEQDDLYISNVLFTVCTIIEQQGRDVFTSDQQFVIRSLAQEALKRAEAVQGTNGEFLLVDAICEHARNCIDLLGRESRPTELGS